MGNEVFKTLVVPNLKTYSSVIEPELGLDFQEDESLMEIEQHLDGLAAIRKNEAAHCLEALLVSDNR